MNSLTKRTIQALPLETAVPFLLALTLFVFPLSSSAKSIVLPLALLAIIAIPANRLKILQTIYQPWCQAAVLLFCMALIGCSYSTATYGEKLMVLSKYGKLLYLPILVVGFRNIKARHWGMNAFLAAMIVTVFFNILEVSGLHYFGESKGNGQVFRNHIMVSHMMAFAAYLAALFSMSQIGKRRMVYGGLLVLFSYQLLFLSESRTGYVIYVFLMIFLLWEILPRQKALLGMAVVFFIFACSFYQNDTMRFRIYDGLSDLQYYQNDQKDTALGYRLQFHEFAKQHFKAHPWFGNGTAGFTAAYREERPVASWSRRLLEPHSQYWLIASEWGGLGLIGLAFFFLSLFLASFKLPNLRIIALGLLWPFVIGNLSDSLLFYSGSGYFFLLWIALCLGDEEVVLSESGQDERLMIPT